MNPFARPTDRWELEPWDEPATSIGESGPSREADEPDPTFVPMPFLGFTHRPPKHRRNDPATRNSEETP